MQHKKGLWRQRLYSGGVFLLVLVMALTAALPTAFAAVTKEQINNLKNQASSLSTQKANVQAELDALANSKNAAIEKKFLLEEKINVLKEEIATSESLIADYGEMIAQKEVELAEAQAQEAKYYEEFCDRVRVMEERGKISYWAVLFNANSFSDLLDQINAISEVVDYDNKIMEQLAIAREAVATAKADLEESKAGEEATKAELTRQKSELETEQAKVDAVINEITTQSATYEEKLHELEDDSENLAKEIQQAEATYAAQLEAQRKAEEEKKRQEEERKRQEEAAKKNNQSSANSSSGSSAGTSTGGGTTASTSGYIWPLTGYTNISSPFGWRNCPFHGREYHSGVDITAPSGTPIKATKSGVVLISTYGSSYGNYVTVAHSDGGRSLYAHMSARAVSAGQTVTQGQVIGYVGTTGSSTGNHLHFELWMGNSSSSRVNPVAYCL